MAKISHNVSTGKGLFLLGELELKQMSHCFFVTEGFLFFVRISLSSEPVIVGGERMTKISRWDENHSYAM